MKNIVNLVRDRSEGVPCGTKIQAVVGASESNLKLHDLLQALL